MTVADLRKALDGIPDEMKVVLSSDAEGNSYHLLSMVVGRLPVTFSETRWGGTSVELAEHGATEAIVLFPED